MSFFRNNWLTKRILSGCIVAILLVVAYAPQAPTTHDAEAIFGVGDTVLVVGGPGTVAQIATAASVSSLLYAYLGKEYPAGMDNWAWLLVDLFIEAMTQTIVNWINSGFDDSPAFVADLEQFLVDLADQTFGGFIEELGLGFLCSPFELDIRIALSIKYQKAKDFSSKAQCTLTDIIDNVEGFFAGDIGGWDDWFEVTLKPQNNPYGTLLIASSEAEARITNKKGQEINLLAFGEGFLSFRKCDEVDEGPPHCYISTPGAVIESQLNNVLNIPNDRLSVADEINEIVSALLGQLLKTVFTEGLASFSDGGGNGGYFDDTILPDWTTITGPSDPNDPTGSNLDRDLNAALAIETAYSEQVQETIDLINTAESSAADCGITLTPKLIDARAELNDYLVESRVAIARLEALLAESSRATTIQEVIAINNEFHNLIAEGLIHTEADLQYLEYELSLVEAAIGQFRRQDLAIACGTLG